MNKYNLTVAEAELLGRVYNNLVEAELLSSDTDFEAFMCAALTGDVFDFKKFLRGEETHVPF